MPKRKANYQTMNSVARRYRKDSSHAKSQLDAIYIRDRGICWICRKHVPRDLASRDHFPIAFKDCTKEQARALSNMKLAHQKCNFDRERGRIVLVDPERLKFIPRTAVLSYRIAEAFPDFPKWEETA